MVAAGLSVAPPAAALTADCDENFEIADSETLASERKLKKNKSEVGHEDVLAGSAEELHVQLVTDNDELTWQVFFIDADNKCSDYTAGECNGENVIDQQDEEQTCTLNDPSSGTRDYYVKVLNSEDAPADSLKYKMWVE